MIRDHFEDNIDFFVNELGTRSSVIVKRFFIGIEQPIQAALLFIDGFVDKTVIDRDILSPLMLHAKENLSLRKDVAQYLCKKYITVGSTQLEADKQNAISSLKKGSSLLILCKAAEFIVIDTSGGKYRQIQDPINETSIRGPREGFVESINFNLNMLRRRIHDKNLTIDFFTVGRRSQTEVAIAYIDDIVDKDIVEELKKRINSIDIDCVTDSGIIEQFIEDKTYSIFPQFFGTEKIDRIVANIMEGRIALLVNGTPSVLTVPTLVTEFFHSVEDYYQRTLISNAIRMLRFLAMFIVITLPAIYLTLIKFNCELIPISFIVPIVQSRTGISLTPFLEIVIMEILVEFLREGGLRLPSKIAQTLSIVGGIIIGDAAVQTKVVSPTTLLIVGVTVVASFLIPNYEMSIVIRLIRFPMLLLANIMGIFGIAVGYIFLIVHLSSLDSFGVPYMSFPKSDLKDTFVRAPLWQMEKRPDAIPNSNEIRQKRREE